MFKLDGSQKTCTRYGVPVFYRRFDPDLIFGSDTVLQVVVWAAGATTGVGNRPSLPSQPARPHE